MTFSRTVGPRPGVLRVQLWPGARGEPPRGGPRAGDLPVPVWPRWHRQEVPAEGGSGGGTVPASPRHRQRMGSGSFVPPRRFNSSNCGFTLEIPPGVAGSPAGGGTQRGSPPPAGRGLQPHPPPKTGIAHIGGSGASLLLKGGCRLPSALRPPPPTHPGLFFFLRSLVFFGKKLAARGEGANGKAGRAPAALPGTESPPPRLRPGLQLLFRAFPLSRRVAVSRASEPRARGTGGSERGAPGPAPPGAGALTSNALTLETPRLLR